MAQADARAQPRSEIVVDRSAAAPRLPRAVAALAGAAVIGFAAQLLFFDAALGINVPIAIALLLAAGWLVRDAARALPGWSDAWLPVSAMVLAGFLALRDDPTLANLDVLGAFALAGGSLATFGGQAVVRRSALGVLSAASHVAGAVAIGGRKVLGAARRALPDGQLRTLSGRAAPILRGLLIAVPLLFLFALLFSAADAVFARTLDDLFDLDLGSLPGRLAIAVVAAWLAAGALGFVAEPTETSDAALAGAWDRRPRFGSTEAITVLVALDLLFALFAWLQAAYLFGGRDTLAASGFTYAEYARRGFFELLAVAFGVAALITIVHAVVRERSRAYLAAAIGLVLLTGVVLVSAYLRLRLYQDAYGWTELRFYVLAAIAWLGLGTVAAVIALATGRFAWMGHLMVMVSIVFGLAFNLIGPVRFIAEQNVQRAIHPELVAPGGETGLDIWYLASLGDDAVIVLAEALPNLPDAERGLTRDVLAARARQLLADEPQGGTWQAWSLSHQRARELLLTCPFVPCLLANP
jgi:hypothetical protein